MSTFHLALLGLLVLVTIGVPTYGQGDGDNLDMQGVNETEGDEMEEGQMNNDGIQMFVKIRGKSGKITISRQREIRRDPNAVTLDFDSICEVGASGTEVGERGRNKHCLKNFAQVKFRFLRPKNTTYDGVAANRLTFHAGVPGANGSIRASIYLFQERGNISSGGEITEVEPGNVKLNIEILNWEFCGTEGTGTEQTCGGQGNRPNEVGTFVDFNLLVKGRKPLGERTGAHKKNRTQGRDFSLGDDVDFVLSNKVQKDGSWENMTDGYPLVGAQGQTTKITFRFPKFVNHTLYDPVIDMTGATIAPLVDNDNDEAEDGAAVFAVSLGFTLFIAMLRFLF